MSAVAPPEEVPDKERLRQIGRKVRRRLAKNKDVQPIPVDNAELWAVGNFIDVVDCGRLMAMIDSVAQPSKAYLVDYASGIRTSYTGIVDPHDPFIEALQKRIDDLLGIDSSLGEAIQGQRYTAGQEFKPHIDWFATNTAIWDQEKDRGGQRSFTAMAYLNHVEEGGATDFPRLGIAIQPQPGTLLIWNNADPDGVPNPWTAHAGSPVLRGMKYIITEWYRARRWL